MRHVRAVVIIALFLSFTSAVCRAQTPFTVGGDPRVDAEDFRITTFASGLNFPFGLQQLSDGSLLVATSNPTGGSFFSSTGELVRLVDADGDGVADGAGQVLATGLPGMVTGLQRIGDLIFVASSNETAPAITVLRTGATAADSLTSVGSVNLSFPTGTWHTTYALAAWPTPGVSGNFHLSFNIGSQGNHPASDGANAATASGLISGTLTRDSIYKLTVDDTGASTTLSGLTQIAGGLRNAAGIQVHPGTGDLWFEDNGIDGLVDGNEPLSADELNRISAADVGGAVEHFGYSDDYIQYRTGDRVGTGAVQPVVAFQPLPDADGSESEGPSQIAFAPANFPAGLRDGIFVGFHGKFFDSGVANEENPLVYFDPTTGQYFHFISNDEPNIGHLNGLLSTNDSLFLADFGTTTATTGDGAIYQIQVTPKPLTAWQNTLERLDVDGDGEVIALDALVVINHLNSTGARALQNPPPQFAAPPPFLDVDGNGFLTPIDALLVINFVNGDQSPMLVPEPSTWVLAIVGLVVLPMGRRFGRRAKRRGRK